MGCGVFLGVVCSVFGVRCDSCVCFRAMLLSVVYCRVCCGLRLGCGVVFECHRVQVHACVGLHMFVNFHSSESGCVYIVLLLELVNVL